MLAVGSIPVFVMMLKSKVWHVGFYHYWVNWIQASWFRSHNRKITFFSYSSNYSVNPDDLHKSIFNFSSVCGFTCILVCFNKICRACVQVTSGIWQKFWRCSHFVFVFHFFLLRGNDTLNNAPPFRCWISVLGTPTEGWPKNRTVRIFWYHAQLLTIEMQIISHCTKLNCTAWWKRSFLCHLWHVNLHVNFTLVSSFQGCKFWETGSQRLNPNCLKSHMGEVWNYH